MDLWKSPRCSWNTGEPSRGIGLEGMSPQRNSRVKTKQNLSEQNSVSLRITALPLELLQGAWGGHVFPADQEQGVWLVIIITYKTWCMFSALTQQVLYRTEPAVGLCMSVGGTGHGVSFPNLPHEARAPLGVFSLSQVFWFLNTVSFGKILTLLSWHLMLLKVLQLFCFSL